MKKINVAVIGCGNISGIYLKNLTELFTNINIYAVSDLVKENVNKAAEEYHINKIMTLEEILADDNVEIVLNLTTPPLHYEICKKILNSGKHVYVEKPISISFEDGKELIELADKKGLLIGCAPDTFMGAGIQTCKKIIDDGLIGDVIGATAFMMSHGHESWHPAPEFYYNVGGGPMFDMGPYYLTALVSMIGCVKSVSGMTSISFPERTITSKPKYGQKIKVEVPTHVNGLLRFQNGAIGNIITSFDVWGSTLPRIEIYGTRGSIIVPDPNAFDGEIMLKQYFDEDFKPYPQTGIYSENSRGIGLCDMANCILEGRLNNRASGKMGVHVLEIMEALHRSSVEKREIELISSCDIPKPLPINLTNGEV